MPIASEPRIYAAFSRSNEEVGALIRKFTGGDVNHALLIWRDPTFNCWLTLGANANGLTIETLKNFKDQIIHLYAPEPGATGLIVGLQVWANWLNCPYDYAGLIGMSVVEASRLIAHRTVVNPTLTPHHLFCSEYVKNVIHDSGYVNVLGGQPAGSVDPFELSDALGHTLPFAEYDPVGTLRL